MAHELNMSLEQYMLIKNKLIPKHLNCNENQRRKDLIRKEILAESPLEIIQKAKQKYLRPIGQIQTIMDHFHSKFDNKRINKINSSTHQKPKRKRADSKVSEGSAAEREQESQMRYLINLPLIEKAKKGAQRYREIINAEAIKQKQERKSKIMKQFGDYMDAQLKGNPKFSIKRRLKTIE